MDPISLILDLSLPQQCLPIHSDILSQLSQLPACSSLSRIADQAFTVEPFANLLPMLTSFYCLKLLLLRLLTSDWRFWVCNYSSAYLHLWKLVLFWKKRWTWLAPSKTKDKAGSSQTMLSAFYQFAWKQAYKYLKNQALIIKSYLF